MGTVASTSDFFDGSEAGMDPFTGLAPDATEEDRERARKAKLRRDAAATANTNVGAGGAGRGRAAGGRSVNPETGQAYTGAERPNEGTFTGSILPTLKAISKDPVTAGILLAPYGVLGAGAAMGAMGPGAAFGGATQATSALPMSAPFTMASPHVAGTATGITAGAAGTTAATTAATAATAGKAASDAWNWKDTLHVATPFVGTAVKYGLDALLGDDGSKETKALIAKQEQMAREASVRRDQAAQSRMDALGQQVLAFNPLNQAMAEMYGPGAAFSPEQMAGMVGNPVGPPRLDPKLVDYRGNDPKARAEIDDWSRRYKEYEAAEAARKDKVMGGFQQPGPGPAPLKPITPQPARRY